MNGKMREWFRNWRWALAASLFLHALIATFLFYGLPRPEQQPDQQEQPVNVAIVPPPEQPKPKPAPKPPEPTPEKKAEKPPEQPVQKPPPPQLPKPQDIPVLKRVFQYGEKDTGPEKSPDGGSAPANAPSPAQDEAAKPPVEPKPAPSQPAPPATPEQQADSNKATEDTDKQQQDKQEAAPQTAEKPASEAPKPLTADAGDKSAPAEKAKPKPSKAMKFKSARALRAPGLNPGRSNPADSDVAGSPIYSGLPGVRKLYSPGATGNALATSSMENVPRDQRIANLCANVLNQELQSADYAPKWLPTIPLKQGNVLNPPQAAFSTTTQWYDLSFRCEVDADATRVLSFNFRVGGLVPPGDWTRRRFPSLR
ncbi:DUF930 domain-containing protein [Mesorhizobium sp. M2D.F.Ca.ET.185.01.1.1]|uniref:DUF930 domain-containing protein n=1 Tax=unclassified Mesorhizobium TaxID=325217 RepID=UPI000FC9EBF3|nr:MULTISPECIES: DUF930 domain-containing protein [unclassified Mesorhizobium]TGP73770.1 DUF930 domain-containing protein [bacterium M00.F.Ca.ET.227.01.1.1]TGP86363.1 DUF930 domain-containing protein [bacterium M00.F.Ca.ET.221.01.1.1]TGP86672.1 DUF930 domain-containing protein [bacterium M00.F.Ca.ET.222.01.1.1]TGT96010.1 DUF930 domain-containing protein [bacterium M00.F.Ca.ET.163.01.1.1]TGU18431.1 DUF930 domain-containing protein [bacterium M00.F.Ca.ET.156.01.1.1]TGU43327.1 DUF930 domain-cont